MKLAQMRLRARNVFIGSPSPRPSPFGRVGIVYHLAISLCVVVFLTIGSGIAVADQQEQTSAREVAGKLDSLKQAIATEVTTELQRTNFNSSYTTVWRAYEDASIKALEKILPKYVPDLTENNFDSGKTGSEKNRLADLTIVCGTNLIEISIKSARRSANPENDMGTFNEHPQRQKLFFASFTLWVRYDDSKPEIHCDRVFFDQTWRFVGKSSLVDGVKYRKKDGNMRPKPWTMFDSGKSYWRTDKQFEAAVKRSETYRANELIKEHLQDLSEDDQRMLYERLKNKFQPGQPVKNQVEK